jgi:DNA-binding MarR family transcriptional regulator
MTDLIDTTEMYLRTIIELEEENIVPLRARISERLGHSGPTVSQTVARMERDGLIERQRCAQDARRTVVKATPEGLAKVQALSETIEAHYAWMEQELGKTKLMALYELLDGVIALEAQDIALSE